MDRGDVSHNRIVDVLAEHGPHLTTDHVLVETWLLVSRRIDAGIADDVVESATDGAVQIEFVQAADLSKAREIRAAFPDQTFSLVDRTSFAVMERLEVTTAVSLDDDFIVYRFGPRRRRAFEVLR